MTRSRASAALFAIALLAGPSSAAGQWAISAGLRAPRFSGGAVEPATSRSLRPYRPTVFEAGIDRVGRRVGVGLLVHYASSSLALEGEDALAAVKNALTVYGAEPRLLIRLTRVGTDGVLRFSGGPLLEVWKLADAGSRTRVGLAAALELHVSLGERWAGIARMGAAVTPGSPFTSADLDPALKPCALWRREVAASLGYRL
jgi:hypothetical protein